MQKIKFWMILVCFILFLIISGSFHNTFAWDATTAVSKVDNYGTVGGNLTSTTKKVMATVIAVIRTVGTGIAIIMITYVAIKYMTAAPQEKADFKKSAVALVVGAIVLFAGTNILNVIADFATTNIS